MGNNSSSILELVNLTVFRGSIPILEGINLRIEEGKIYGLIGLNGAGKTTLMEAIMGLLPYRGDIKLYGKSIKKVPTWEIKVSYVPQEENVFKRLKVFENIQLAQMLKKSKLPSDEVLDFFPIVKKRSNQIASTLSGGESRQLAIALALIDLQKLLLLDEPLTGLSPKIALDTLNLLKNIKEKFNVSVLISEQNLKVADILDFIYVLRNGKIWAEFASEEWLSLEKEEMSKIIFEGKRE